MFGKKQQQPGNGPERFREENVGKKIAGGISIAVIVIFALILLGGSFYSLKENEYAVITTFGVPKVVEESGIHVKIPVIQELSRVPKTINGFTIGYDSSTGEYIDRESFMITRDYNFVNVDFYVEYRVTDPTKYLYASEAPVSILKNLTQSYIRDTIGLYDVDSVITTGKNEIQASIKQKIINRLETEDIGVQLVNITIQDAEPPTTEVIDAFKNVENAKQGKETAINNANKDRNEKIPQAEAECDQIIKTAEAEKEARINEAQGQVSRFEQMYAEYSKYPLITKQRMFYETMEDLLPTMKVYIVDENGTQKLLPLDSFTAAQDSDPADTTIGKEAQ